MIPTYTQHSPEPQGIYWKLLYEENNHSVLNLIVNSRWQGSVEPADDGWYTAYDRTQELSKWRSEHGAMEWVTHRAMVLDQLSRK